MTDTERDTLPKDRDGIAVQHDEQALRGGGTLTVQLTTD